ncbi:MAG: hypothetical protein Q8J88_01145 [Bacteroidales bacterium]|nr:hypothetical protein [Bacteroidales bacterium]
MNKIGENEWEKLIDGLVENFQPDELITHEYIKSKFLIVAPEYEEFESVTEFIEAINLQQFEYMSLIEKLRLDVLDRHKLYMSNIRGFGYKFLKPSEQTTYAREKAIDAVKKELNRGLLILKNIRHDSLTMEERKRNSDEMAKLGQLKQMLKIV